MDSASPIVENTIKDLNFVQQRMNLNMEPLRADKLTVNAILLYDAVNVYAKALESLGTAKKITAQPLQCMNSPFTSWSNGFRLINFLRVVRTRF